MGDVKGLGRMQGTVWSYRTKSLLLFFLSLILDTSLHQKNKKMLIFFQMY